MFGIFSQKVTYEKALIVKVSCVGSEVRKYEVLANSDSELSITKHDEVIVPDDRGWRDIVLSVSLIFELEFFLAV